MAILKKAVSEGEEELRPVQSHTRVRPRGYPEDDGKLTMTSQILTKQF